jgi:Leucine-rich repeat (LRR) protein
MKIKNIALLFLLVSSFGNANEKNRDSEGLMLHLYPKNICDDPFALDTDRISSPSEDPFADPNSKVEAPYDPFADPKSNAQRTEEDRRKRGLHLTQGAFLKRLRALDPKQFSKTKAKEFAKLTQLHLDDLTLTDDDFLCLVKWMPALENLYLWSCNFPKSSLEHLTGLKDLTKLSLQFCGLGNESMGTLSKLKALTSLNLTGNSKGFTDKGLEGLARLEHLEHLDLSAISLIKGPGLRHLVKLKHLSELDLGHSFDCNGIRDEGFDHLAKMAALKKLSLRYCTEFSPESLDKLTGLKNLEVIDFSDSFHFRDDKKGIRPALARLQKALPDCKLLVSKRFENEEDFMKRAASKVEGYDPYDPFA